MAMLDVRVLGVPEFRVEGVLLDSLTRKSAAILTWLAVSEGPRTRSAAAELFWPTNGRRNLRQELYVLRRLPAAGQWLEVGETIRLRCATDIGALTEGGDPRALWRGPLGHGLDEIRSAPFQEWLLVQRSRVDHERERAVITWCRHALERGEVDAATDAITPLLGPAASEPVWLTAVEALLGAGRIAEATSTVASAGRHVHTEGPQWTSLTARLQRSPSLRSLPSAARDVLRVAALDPDPLPVAVLAQVLEVTPPSLLPHLEVLHGAGLWNDGALTAEVREHISKDTPVHVGAALHGELVRALEMEGASPARIARHVEGAGRPDASAVWLALAHQTGSPQAVAGAIRTARTAGERTAALVEGVVAARTRGDLAEARRHWRSLEDHGVRVQEPRAVVQTVVQEVLLAIVERDLATARRALTRAAELMGAESPDVHALEGILGFVVGDYSGAEVHLELGSHAADPALRVSVANARGALAAFGGDGAGAREFHLGGLRDARAHGRLAVVVRLLNSMGADAFVKQDVDAAADWLGQAERLAEGIGDPRVLHSVRFNLAQVHLALGHLGEVRKVAAALIDGAEGAYERGRAYRTRAELERAVERLPEASRWSDRAGAEFQLAGDALQEALSAFNGALARRGSEGGWLALDRALEKVVALERADLSATARCEVAIVHPNRGRVQALLPSTASTDLEQAVLARAEALGLRGGTTKQNEMPGLLGAYRRALSVPAASRAALEAELLAQAVSWGEGLLGSQRDALHARVLRWLRDPERAF